MAIRFLFIFLSYVLHKTNVKSFLKKRLLNIILFKSFSYILPDDEISLKTVNSV